MIVFYRKSDNSVLSYISAEHPGLEKCAKNHGLKVEDIGVMSFKHEEDKEDFKDNLNDIPKEKLEVCSKIELTELGGEI